MQRVVLPEFLWDPSDVAIKMSQSPPLQLLTVQASSQALVEIAQLNLNLKFKVM